jgi:transcriptional regulator with PAS, ATPase and Fis domain
MSDTFDSMIGECPAMRAVFATIERVAATDLTVLVLGETGTGKELVARSLHQRSTRRLGPFVALNCAALPATLIESELFGFEKGSFTGAVSARPGHVEMAHGGTLFLDEIAEMPLGAQAKLLRVVQEKRVQRIGATHDRKVDLRIVAATHQDLALLVDAHTFRRDLYHRLDEMQIRLPPLRDRGDDLDRIADFVLERLAGEHGRPLRLGVAARAALRAHVWPGNVRELENALRRAAARASGPEIAPDELQLAPAESARTLAEIVDAATESAVRSSLRHHAGDPEAAARELGIELPELRRLAQHYGVSPR